MATPRIGSARSIIETRRTRQTPRPSNAFQKVLVGGANMLLSGASIATQVVGLPTLSAAINRARVGTSVSGPAFGSATSGGSVGSQPPSPDEAMKQLQDQRMQDDLKLLALQSSIQQQNRQISLVSNVLKARHDTAKAAIGNIRS